MEKIWLLAGTTEGRLIAEKAGRLGLECYASTATEYGKDQLDSAAGVKAISGRMDEGKMEAFIREREIGMVIDATHPFARAVTENIQKACKRTGCRYMRCLRKKVCVQVKESEAAFFPSIEEAVDFLKGTEGNILVGTGSKDLKAYTRIPNYKERCYVRVLSTLSSVELAASLGFEGAHLAAMQGPFSKEMNLALLRQTKASYFVTKESGSEGGFKEKLQAAREAGVYLIVIARREEAGMSLEEVMEYLEKTDR